ncbi:MAG: glycosyltransferase family 4 protein [candidate division WOR-3 bacterium]
MNIAIFSESFLPLKTGVAKFTYELAYHLRKRNHNVILITGEFGLNYNFDFEVIKIGKIFKVYANGSYTYFILENPISIYEKLKNVLKLYKIEIFHNQGPLGPPFSILSSYFAKRINKDIKTIGTFHSKQMKISKSLKLYSKFAKKFINYNDVLTAPSLSTANEMKLLFNVNVQVIPNGIDLNKFNISKGKLKELENDKYKILFVGRLDYRKGIDILLKAFELINNENMELIIVGNGPYKNLVLKYKKKLKNIKLFDNVDDEKLVLFYNSSDVCVFPTRGGEAFGIVLLEAFACSKPVICSNIDGYNEVANTNCALFFNPEDYIELSECLMKLYSDENLRNFLSKNAINRALEFSWDKVILEFEKLYHKVS